MHVFNTSLLVLCTLVVSASVAHAQVVGGTQLEFDTNLFSQGASDNEIVVGTTTIEFQQAALIDAQTRLQNLLYYIRTLDSSESLLLTTGATASSSVETYNNVADIAFVGDGTPFRIGTSTATTTYTAPVFPDDYIGSGTVVRTTATPQQSCPVFTVNFNVGDDHPEVERVQAFLNKSEVTRVAVEGPGAEGSLTTFFGVRTRAAVRAFQAHHRAEVLTSVGLQAPTGYWGPSSRAHANRLLGCDVQ